MNFFKLPETILNQLIDSALRGIGAAALPLVDAVRNEISKQLSNEHSSEIASPERVEDETKN